MNDQMHELDDHAENAETHESAGEWSDLDFEAALDAVERGDPLPDGLPADTAADLAVARQLFAQRVNPGEALASRGFADASALQSAREGFSRADQPPGGRFGFPRARRWLPEAAVLLVVLGLGAAVATQLPRITGGPSGEARPTDVSGEAAGSTATPLATADAVAGSNDLAGVMDETSDATPVPAYPAPARTATGAYRLTGQVLLDKWLGRIRARGSVDGKEALIYLSTDDAALLSYSAEAAGARDGKFTFSDKWLAFDLGDRLVVDGESGGSIDLSAAPASSGPRDTVPAPLADTATGQVLVFRDNHVLVADPATGKVVRTLGFDVRREGNGQADDGPLPITNAILDPDRRILYLDFITYSSIPWVYHTLVAYDLESGKELGRGPGSSSYAAVAADGALYGASWNRMGVSHVWKWRDGTPEIFSDNWGGYPIGIAHDPDRGRVYVATASQLRVFDAATMMLLSLTPLPFRLDASSDHPSSMIGHDPKTDRLLFVVDGRLEHMPVADLEMPPAVAPGSEPPPSTAVRELHLSPRWPTDQTMFGVWGTGTHGPACDAFGQTGGRMFISGDAGRSWKRAPGNLGTICDQVAGLALLPSAAADRPPILLAGVPGLGIFRSEDSGAWWHPSGAGLNNAGVTQLRQAPGDDGTIFSAGPLGEMHVSTAADQGRIWRSLGQNLPVFDISPDFGADGTLLGAGNTDQDGDALDPALQLSRDRGATWQRVGPVPDWPDATRGLGVEMLSVAPLFAKWGVAFLYHTDGALYRTADGGQTWARVLDGLGHPTATPQIVYGPEEESRSVYLITATSDNPARDPASGRLRYFRSGDGGQTWDEIPVDIDGAPSALAPAPDFAASGRLFVGTADGRVLEETLAVR